MLNPHLQERQGEHVPIVVVGNKADVGEEKRAMRRETAEAIACVDWESGYVEATAKDNCCVVEVFKEILRQAKVCNLIFLFVYFFKR